MDDPAARTVTIELHGWAHGGEAVGRLPDGRACFVPYALPGETVQVRVTRQYKRHATAELVSVVVASPHRVSAPCPYYGVCGGCQLQHAAPAHQLQLKRRVLVEQLTRIGRQPDPPVAEVTAPAGGWPAGYRSWARMAVDDEGRLGFRRRASHAIEPIAHCLLMTPEASALRDAAGDGWQGAHEVTLTAGEDSGLLTVHPGGDGLPLIPDGTFGVGIRQADPAGPTAVIRPPDHVTVQVGGIALRASAGAFFQAGPAGAAALVEAVMAAVDPAPGEHILDLYAGVGLFSAFLARRGARVTAVEADPVATADARANLAGLGVEVRTETVEEALADVDAADVVLLDPPRSGAKAQVCAAIVAMAPRRIVYVACDPAALARDVATLTDLGYRLQFVQGIDLFGHTAHVEAVAVLLPAVPGEGSAGTTDREGWRGPPP
ncbi:MAG TPA: class I SAM-dependent RNA methyltransferase [Euzebya sp.]|nr:class I SAM-dependent RNA methyltransferase [Euzebya sp.]